MFKSSDASSIFRTYLILTLVHSLSRYLFDWTGLVCRVCVRARASLFYRSNTNREEKEKSRHGSEKVIFNRNPRRKKYPNTHRVTKHTQQNHLIYTIIRVFFVQICLVWSFSFSFQRVFSPKNFLFKWLEPKFDTTHWFHNKIKFFVFIYTFRCRIRQPQRAQTHTHTQISHGIEQKIEKGEENKKKTERIRVVVCANETLTAKLTPYLQCFSQ